jgi:anthranilate synthase component I
MAVYTRTLVADALTPVRAYAALRASDPESASFLLESVVGGERWGRYSILGYRPRYEAVLDRRGWNLRPGSGDPTGAKLPKIAFDSSLDPITSSGALFRRSGGGAQQTTSSSMAETFAASHVGYLAWDIIHRIDKVPAGNDETWTKHFVPLARFMGGATVVVFDALAQTVTIASEEKADVDRAFDDMHRAVTLSDIALPDRARVPTNITTELSDDEYKARVLRAKEYIAAGDAFQIVLARTFSVPRAGRDPFDVYRAMRLVNPSPYMYFLDLPGVGEDGVSTGERLRIAGASPETMVRLHEGTMTVRPLAGTRPRGKTEAEDAALEKELLADPKERAEHVMLIDLGRNDVGRVAKIGTVSLLRKMEIERYSHVMHIVSEVRGNIPDTTPPLEVARAAFPAGTLSGAPKVRAMQIIRELEARPRGIYGGAIGYVGATGDLDLAIAIRTLVCKGDTFEVTAGAGIVEASDPQSEADETRNKARGVLCAIAAV